MDRSEKPFEAKKVLEDVKIISQILLDVQESLKILEYLITEDPTNDIYLKNNESFWQFTSTIYADHILLKINILTSNKEHYSLKKLLRTIRNDDKYSDLISQGLSEKWERDYTFLEKSIEKIRKLRNKLIAHRDRDADIKDFQAISLKEIKAFVSTTQQTLKEIYYIISDSTYQFESVIGSPVENLRKIMSSLNEHRRTELSELFEQGRIHGLDDELPESEKTVNKS